MFLTPQIIKRLSVSVGFKRSITNIDFLKEHVDKYMSKIVSDLIKLVEYSGKNTIKVSDINVLHYISKEFNNVISPIGLKNNFKYSHTKTFKNYIKSLIKKYSNMETRLSPDALIVLLEIVELYIINLFGMIRKIYNHTSLLDKDLKTIINLGSLSASYTC